MLDIYGTDGMLDRGKVIARLDEVLAAPGPSGNPSRISTATRAALLDLLDECSEGYTHNPLDAPTMVRDYIAACRPATRPAPTALERICAGQITGDDRDEDWGMMGPAL